MFLKGPRTSLVGRLGENGYKGLYSLVTLAGLVFLGMAYLAGRSGPNSLDMAYDPWLAGRHVMMLMVFVGFILIFANGSKGYIRKFVKHPFSVGIVLWALGHLLVNGEKAVVVIFGMFLLIAALNVVVSLSRGKIPDFEPDWRHDLRAIAVGTVLYFVFALGFHPYVLNIPVLG